MNTTFKIIITLLLATFYSCQKNEVLPIVSGSITIDGVFSGTIVNDSNRIDSIQVYTYDLIGKGEILTDGKFSLKLTIPPLDQITAFPSGIVVSDTKAMYSTPFICSTYKGRVYKGDIFKTNYLVTESTKAGNTASQFIYSDRDFSIIGTNVISEIDNRITFYHKLNYNVLFKKGWNEIVYKIDTYSKTSNTLTVVETYSNNITSDLQWRYLSFYGSSSIQAKTYGVQNSVRQGLLFQ